MIKKGRGWKMTGIIIVGAIVIIIVLIFIKKRKKKKFRLKTDPIPRNLGFLIKNGSPMTAQLRSSIPFPFESNLKKRMLQEHPTWKEYDFDWRMFELKRYFVLNGLLKTVPMFSSEVDKVWHEMLMFTKDYERFSQLFYKEFLHHTPNMDVKPIPGERAFFDWLYLSLFKPKLNSHLLWGSFLKNPIKLEILQDFQQRSEKELLSLYFRQTDEWVEIKTYLIRKMKKEIAKAEQLDKEKPSFAKIKTENDYYQLLPAAVFFSLYGADKYFDQMHGLLPMQAQAASSGGSSSCVGYACGSSKSDDGGSSCSSGCSSCGGGCS